MPIYVFESDDGERIEREFPASDFPSRIELRGKVFRKILSPGIILGVPTRLKAVNEIERAEEIAYGTACFNAPNKNNPGGMSNRELVEKGLATTGDMKRWV